MLKVHGRRLTVRLGSMDRRRFAKVTTSRVASRMRKVGRREPLRELP